MKSFCIDIHPRLENVRFTVKNGAQFSRDIISGSYGQTNINIDSNDIKRVSRFAIKYGDHKASNRGKWYAQCTTFAMGLLVTNESNIRKVSINTYRPYGTTKITL